MSEISSNSTTDSSTDVPRANEAPPVLAQNDSNSAESSSSGSPRPTQDTRRKRRRIMEEETLESISSEDENYQRLESELRRELADNTGENRPLVRTASHVDEVLVNADSERDPDASSDVIEILGGSNSNSDLENEAKSQQVVEISDDEAVASPRPQHKRALDYKCPICFEPPEAALVTPCGHVFCTECLFQMVNSSRGQSRAGHCALCRRGVHFRDVRLIILRKKRPEVQLICGEHTTQNSAIAIYVMRSGPTSRCKTLRSFKKTPTLQFLKKVEARPKKVKKMARALSTGTLIVRYGFLQGIQDMRSFRCRYHGIHHGDLVKPGTWCICRNLVLQPSPLHNDISKGLKKTLHPKMRFKFQ